MKSKTFFAIGFLIVLLIALFASVSFAQGGEVDPMGFVGIIFSPALVIMVGAIVGFTKIVRNTINLKGPFAVVATVVVSIGYSLMQYMTSEGIGIAILVGIVACGVSLAGFKLTKLFGKKVNSEGIK